MGSATRYLVFYNALSFASWTFLTLRTFVLASSLWGEGGLHRLYDELLFPYVAVTQSLAVVEIVHAASGLVRASPTTTAIQVIGKNLVVWTVMVPFPEIIVGSDGTGDVGAWGFLGCLVFWSLSEVIKYGYFVVMLSTGDTPAWLKWLRYTAFIPLYPPGLLSEAWLVYLSLTRMVHVAAWYRFYLFLGLLSYVPASYIMYTHMLSQRRRVMKKQAHQQ
ncbi:tyrosine phosphatase-like protein [Stachybotrys elegans]|uniref:Very-long-chain (3R)-3-hydroxyacyl-CoA dehydratase n=1 Tax=Stachybotrys elegans TaxID=80388 RepID=A0A8K0WM56_9HYPO|nr:tyrosine phosphatase-like protein [Stachybotrys elegans]